MTIGCLSIEETLDLILEKAISSHEGWVEVIPSWEYVLKEVVRELFSSTSSFKAISSNIDYLNTKDPIAFEELFSSFIEVAHRLLICNIGSNYSLLSDNAYTSLKRSLLQRLSQTFSRSLILEFSIFRAIHGDRFTDYSTGHQVDRKRVVYDQFIDKLLSDRLVEFLQEYTVLARLSAVMIEQWVDSTTEFIERFANDRHEIKDVFYPDVNQYLGTITGIYSAISDFHSGGRSVFKLDFSCGLELIYKPRDLGIEKSFFDLLDWINQQEQSIPFKILKVINKSTYGWVEFVKVGICTGDRNLQMFYQRVGRLLCILHILRGSDFHGENIIASGEYPVVFDLEVLFKNTSKFSNISSNLSIQSVYNQLETSVLTVGLLPHWEFSNQGQCFDISGLGGTTGQLTHFKSWKIQNINTDCMAGSHVYSVTRLGNNIPSTKSIELLLSSYKKDIIEGFHSMYCLLHNSREKLLASDSPLRRMAEQNTRFLFRSTYEYWFAINRLLEPKFLRCADDRKIELDKLMNNLSSNEDILKQIIDTEIESLEKLDIPIFKAKPVSLDIVTDSNQTIENIFSKPSFELTIDNLNSLNLQDLERQVYFIKGAIDSRVSQKIQPNLLSDSLPTKVSNCNSVILSTEEFVSQAIAIAEDLQKCAVYSKDGSATWITYGLNTQASALQFHPMSYGLYDGCCGVALFLAALEEVTNSCQFRGLMIAALHPLINRLYTCGESSDLTKEIGIGGVVGLGSIVYSLVRISRFTGESNLLSIATQAASKISVDSIYQDRILDITGGSAGTMLGLISLYQISAEPVLLKKAIDCGRHLINQRITSSSECSMWRTISEHPLTGFAHGAAGIAYALLRLYNITRDRSFLDVAVEAMNFERKAFSIEDGNWQDYRIVTNNNDKPRFMNSWCHGATGIGLSRLATLSIINDSIIDNEIKVALKTTRSSSFRRLDAPCCGNAGIVDFFLIAAKKLHRPELLDLGKQWMSISMSNAKKTECFQYLPSLLGDVYIPGFFQGTAGIGYQMLRTAYPDRLPSVLLLE